MKFKEIEFDSNNVVAAAEYEMVRVLFSDMMKAQTHRVSGIT